GLTSRLVPNQRRGPPDLEDPIARQEMPIADSFPTVSLHELFKLQDMAFEGAPSVNKPCLLVLAAHDHVSDAGAALKLYARLPQAGPAVVLPRGFHGMARDSSAPMLIKAIGDFFKQV